MRDIYSGQRVVQALAPGAYNDGQTGETVDLQGFEGALVVVNVGTVSDGTHAFGLEEADADANGDPTDWGEVDEDDLLGGVGDLDDGGVYRVGYRGNKRFIRVVTESDGTDGAVYGAVAVLGKARHQPVGDGGED